MEAPSAVATVLPDPPAAAAGIPTSLAGFRDRHRGETIVVCGCGASLRDLPEPQRLITIGVNDVGRLFDPTYLVVVNSRHQFSGDRFRYVETSAAQMLFSHLDLGVRHPHQVRFRLGKRGGTDLSDPDVLHYTRNSPYVALCLALHMGASRIGLIGVDFTPGHFFGGSGRHSLDRELAAIDQEYRLLAAAARALGVEVVNLSAQSRLTGLVKVPLGEFLAAPTVLVGRADSAQGRGDMNIGQTDFAGTLVGIETHGKGIVGDFLDALAASAGRLGCRVVREVGSVSARPEAVKILWNGRRYRGVGPAFYCEHGWLPRWAYQISPSGINASSHLAPFAWNGQPLGEAEAAALAHHLDEIRNGGPERYSYMQTQAEAVTGLPEAFLLVPLQMEWDTNIQRHVPQRFRRMQGLVDAVAKADPPLPVIYKQHPADVRRGNGQMRLRLHRRQDAVWAHDRGNIHALLKGGRCRGIASLNSNVVHDGLIWGVPSVVLGRNVWPEGDEGPFLTALPEDWDRLFDLWSDPKRVASRDAYAHYLMTHQWTLSDAADPERLRALLRAHPAASGKTERAPASTRPAPARRQPAVRPPAALRSIGRADEPMINVVALDRGWFFEDLKGHFVAASGPGVRVVASNQPRPDADAWIFIRTREARQTPDPGRTLVHIHDLFDHGLYLPGGERRCVVDCAGVVLTHPAQAGILAANGIDLTGKLTLTRPIGALSTFCLRSKASRVFTLAWVGRPANYQGVDLKRVHWVVETARRLGPRGLRVVLLGEGLERQHDALRRSGIDCRYLNRRAYPIARYPAVYRELDCVLIASRSEAGPLCLFEALASGVPVVSTPVGWAPDLIRDGVNGCLVESVEEMAAAVAGIREQRDVWFQRRAAIRESLGGHTLEGWLRENVALALELTRRQVRTGVNQARDTRQPAPVTGASGR